MKRRYGKRRRTSLGRLAGAVIVPLVLLFAAAPAQAAWTADLTTTPSSTQAGGPTDFTTDVMFGSDTRRSPTGATMAP